MATAAQVAANRANAQHSSGPTSDAGREASSRNNFRHGLTGHALIFLDCEDEGHYDQLVQALEAEHKPKTPTEQILVEKMAQHHWLSQRAQMLQTFQMRNHPSDPEVQKTVANYARYEAQHDRLFQRALHDLLKLRAETRKAEIGFESQKRAQAQETRREAAETRKQEHHKATMSILENKRERELTDNPKVKEAPDGARMEKMAA
jgi:hypothetical protein